MIVWQFGAKLGPVTYLHPVIGDAAVRARRAELLREAGFRRRARRRAVRLPAARRARPVPARAGG